MSSGLEHSQAFHTQLGRRLTAWADRFGPNFVLGLSGGGDSMALALGCARWMQAGAGRVHAICVDHGLRDGSLVEAQKTVAWANSLGLTAQITSLSLPREQARIQERAREGRHRALLDGAKAHNARIVLLAHNQDDQHETIALRLASKTGLDGMAGMGELTPSPFYNDDWPCLLGRPLLNVSRQDLRETLTRASQDWHEDPSNANIAFGRIRARQRLKRLQLDDLDLTALSRIAVLCSTLRKELDDATRDFLTQADFASTATQFSLDYRRINEGSPVIVERALGWLTFAIGGAPRIAPISKLARLRHLIMDPDFAGATLAGAKLQQRGGRLIIQLAPKRTGSIQSPSHNSPDPLLRLQAISGNLDEFVTYLG